MDADETDGPSAHCSSRKATFLNDPIDDADEALVDVKRKAVQDVDFEATTSATSKYSENDDSLNGHSKHRHHFADREGSFEADNADEFFEIDADDLIVQDECCDEELREKPRCFRSNSASFEPCKKVSKKRRQCSTSPLSYRPPTPIVCGESVDIVALMHKAQFFLARSCTENIKIAKEKSLWTTTLSTEKLIGEAFFKASVVILIFLAKGADHFAGFAKVCSEASYKSHPAIRWKEFYGGGNIKLKWISRCALDLKMTKNIKNSFNKEREIYVGRDGCEIQRAAGQKLCSLFPFDGGVNLDALRVTCENDRASRKRSFPVTKRRLSRVFNRELLPSLLDTRFSRSRYRPRDPFMDPFDEYREQGRYVYTRPHVDFVRRNYFTEIPRSLLYDDFSYSQHSHSSYHYRDRPPIPSLLEGVSRISSHFSSRRPVRLLDTMRSNDRHSVRNVRKQNSPSRDGRKRERYDNSISQSSRDEKKPRILKDGERKVSESSSSRRDSKYVFAKRDQEKSIKKELKPSVETRNGKDFAKKAEKHRERHRH